MAGIASLNNFPRKSFTHRLGTFSRSKITGEIKPLFTFGSTPNYGVGPGDFATIYNVLPLWNANPAIDGSGQTIAIVGDSNINPRDVSDFRNMFGLPPLTANQLQIILDGPDPGIIPNTEGEADLDVEWAGAVAKGATIDLVVSEDTESSLGTDLSALYIVDNNLASVISVSFGQCEAALGAGGNAFEKAVWEQAAAQGITVLVASGDSGSATCDAFASPPETAAQFGLAVSGVASTPFNVAVGGTDFDDAGNQSQFWSTTNSSPLENSALSYIPEITWNDSCAQTGLTDCASAMASTRNLVAGGGGPSSCINPSGSFPSFTCGAVNGITGYARPPWQTGAGVPAANARDIPDVSLFAAAGKNGSFYIMCQSDANTGLGSSTTSCNLSSPFTNFLGVGGTSVSTPAFAGIMALINQKTGQRQGNANYVLYKLAAQPGLSCDSSNPATIGSASCVFNDVTRGNISVACAGGSPNCSSTTSGQTGNLVTGTAPSQLAAWTTNAGYDLATGLGTVNAANLVSKWSSVSFTPSATTLSLSTTPATNPITITHGQPVNVTIHVTSGSGTPTGDVSLLSSLPTGITTFPLTSGSFFGATNFLPGGTYTVTAHYAGDGNFVASDSTPPIQVTVNKEPSQTQVGVVTFDINTGQVTSANATSFAYGSPYVVRANVLNSAGNACSPQASPGAPNLFPVSGCPTGTVTITANGNPLPNQGAPSASLFPLNSQGYTEDLPVQFPGGGPYNLVANYSGDASFNPSGPTTVAVNVTKAVTTSTLTANLTTVQSGATVTLTAVVNAQSNGAAPTGTVQFLNGGTAIAGTPTYTGTASSTSPASLQAVLTTTFSATATITAQYNGDGNYDSSTSAATTVTVTTAPPDFTFDANPTSFNISSPGLSGSTTLTMGATNGFTGTASITCSVPATMKEATCSLNPASVTTNGTSTSGTTTLTVSTTAAHTATGFFSGPGWFMGGCVAVIIFLFLLILPAKLRRWKMAFGLAGVVIMAAGMIACGGGSSYTPPPVTDPGTPLGTYTVTVTATSGNLVHTANVTVSVL